MYKGLFTLGASGVLLFGAFSSSSSYQLQNYGVGAGGTNTANSPNYRLNASSGELSGGVGSGSTTVVKPGSIQAQQANVPLAPTLDTGSNTYYNKLIVTVNKGGSDASDYTYSIAVSTDNFVTTLFMQADGTLGGTAVYQTYAAWGGASGTPMIGLSSSTQYKVKVNAMQGTFTASAYGPVATATTANPSLTFSITPTTVALGTLTPTTVVTAGTSVSFGFGTNAVSGGIVYVAGLNAGLLSVTGSYTVPSVSANLTSQTEGFGLRGLTATQTSGGPFTLSSPFNGAANVVGAPTASFRPLYSADAPTVGGSGTTSVMAKSSVTTPAASDYSETLTFIASASF